MSYSAQLRQFLDQARTSNLQTKHYLNTYKGLNVKVSFGQGNTARIPWISFLKEPNSTSDGIYPVYLYYKDQGILILAYGISETNTPQFSWKISDAQSIHEYFNQNYSLKPPRYGSSFVFKVYNVNNMPTDEILDNDLNEIIEQYNSYDFSTGVNLITNKESVGYYVELEKIVAFISDSGLYYSKGLITRFIASLLTKPFVILTGLSGSGKTKLAQVFAQLICQDKDQFLIVPVGADWTNREPLLGYPNSLNPEDYIKPDNGVLDLIIQANYNPDKPYFLILDEMNLSHVERYFADFLSVMESGDEIPLHSGNIKNGVPSRLKLPRNLFVIGTVNIDETTNMFSPKVLDRAITIEFRISENSMGNFLADIKEVNTDALSGKGASMAKSFVELSKDKTLTTKNVQELNEVLLKFFAELKKTGAEFGFRSATEILRLISKLSVIDATLTTHQMIDIAIMQKLLPRLHGSRRKLCPVLETLGSFCVDGSISIIKDVFENEKFDFNQKGILYPLSLEKIYRMYQGAIDNGFASFAEA